MILDTTFLVDVLRGDDSVVELETELDERGSAVVTPISIMELWEGIQLAASSERERERVQQLLEGISTADFDRESAMLAGAMSASLTEAGSPIEIEDVMIGAIARHRGEPVLTRNPDHFARLSSVTTQSY